ncbi:MAG TPA: type II secretion system F family protein, partial [Tepiditoga sp.]|nr:type II secretion system F family protein [Tepiditoga sp.]
MKKLYKIILKDKISDDVYKSYIIMSGPELRELYNFPDHEVMYIKEKGFSPGKLKIKKMYELCQRIYLLCESGYGIYKTVQYIVMNEDVDKFIRAVMFRVFLNFKSGMSVNKAFDVGEFDEYFIYSLKFVVNENTLVNIFRELNEYYLNFQRIKNEIFKAMLYPFILLFSVIVLLVFLNFYFIPSLSRLYGYDINLCFSRIVQNSVFII